MTALKQLEDRDEAILPLRLIAICISTAALLQLIQAVTVLTQTATLR
jgi:hypothetical protein